MGYWNGKTVIITGGGRAVLKDGRCGWTSPIWITKP